MKWGDVVSSDCLVQKASNVSKVRRMGRRKHTGILDPNRRRPPAPSRPQAAFAEDLQRFWAVAYSG